MKKISVKEWNDFIEKNYNESNQWDNAFICEIENLNNDGFYSDKLVKELKKLGFKYVVMNDNDGDLKLYHSEEKVIFDQTNLWKDITQKILESR